eukprot:881905-Prorocentrum_minimum.AAC.1
MATTNRLLRARAPAAHLYGVYAPSAASSAAAASWRSSGGPLASSASASPVRDRSYVCGSSSRGPTLMRGHPQVRVGGRPGPNQGRLSNS